MTLWPFHFGPMDTLFPMQTLALNMCWSKICSHPHYLGQIVFWAKVSWAKVSWAKVSWAKVFFGPKCRLGQNKMAKVSWAKVSLGPKWEIASFKYNLLEDLTVEWKVAI